MAARRAATRSAVLFGAVNPSGKLPVSLPRKFADSPAAANYPGKDLKTAYAEGIYVGYRYFDSKNVEPQFPFGFGLSYTTFEYRDLRLTGKEKKKETGQETGFIYSVTVRNTGKSAGAEVVELYVHDGHAKIDRPAHELKAFKRVELQPGEAKNVELSVNRTAFSYWSPEKRDWTMDPGTFEIQVGASSRDIRLKTSIDIR